MEKSIKMPELGEGVESAVIVDVLVSKGDKIDVDQVILEVETDKATVEVPSEVSGTVKDVLIEKGKTVEVGTDIFILE